MEKVYQVIVIGAGVAGIGASIELTKANIDHIILESRDRIGGRIVSALVDGVQVQLGANYVHHPQSNNKIANLIKQKGIQTKLSNLVQKDQSQFIFEGNNQVGVDVIQRSFGLFDELCIQIQKAKESPVDLSVGQVWQQYSTKIQKEPEQIKNLVKRLLDILGNNQGGRISEISARQYDNDICEFDVVPLMGYYGVFKEIVKNTKAEIKLNEIVTKIDYESQIIKVHTKNHTYLSKKIISSLPLAILQNNIVEFHPKFPEDYRMNLEKIGVSNISKLFVSFEEPFWDVSKVLVYFISKDEQIKYPAAVSIVKEGKYMLCFFPSVSQNSSLNSSSDEDIMKDLLSFLKKFKFQKEIAVKTFLITRWEKDPFSLGAYSFFKVGQTADVDSLRKPIDNKIWLIGQYCHPEMSGCAHAAFETGQWAAQEIISQAKK